VAASRAERQSAVQLGLSTVIVVAESLSHGTVPRPRQVLGIGIVFGALSLVEVMPEPWPNVASKFGWLIVLTLAITAVTLTTRPDGTNVLTQLAGIGGGSAPLFPQQQPAS
jgi:hypothetical protein